MLETSTGKLIVAVVLVLAVSAATLAGIGFLGGGEDGREDTGPPWENPLCAGTAQNLTTQDTTTATPPGDGTVLTSAPVPGVAVRSTDVPGVTIEVDEQNESVTFRIVDPGWVKLVYITGDHQYQNYPLVCGRVMTLSRDELKEHGELHLIGGVVGDASQVDLGVKRENGTRVLTEDPSSGPGVNMGVMQSVSYDFREKEQP